MRTFRLLAAALAASPLAACARPHAPGSTPPAAAACPPVPAAAAARATPFDSDSAHAVAALVGDYDLVAVDTTGGMPDGQVRGRLALRPTAPAELYYAPSGERSGAVRRVQPLTGRWDVERAAPRTPVASTLRLRRNVLVDEAPNCHDCGSGRYRIERVSADGFWGTWDGDLGAVYVIGPRGEAISRFAGPFCAMRRRPGPIDSHQP